MDELKQSVQLAVHEQKDPLLIYKFEAFELFKEMLENVNRLTAHVYQVSESEIQPTVRSVQEITATINRNVGRLDELFNMLGDFSEQTVKRAGSYRDQFTRPITDFISVWSALKSGLQVCTRLLRPNMAQSSNNSEGSHHQETQNE